MKSNMKMDIFNFTFWKKLPLLLFYMEVLHDSSAASYDDPNCIIDSNLPATASNNYVDCTVDLQVNLGRTECCTIDGAIGCCKPGDRWEQFKLIGICLGAATAGLAVFLIYYHWIQRSDNPKILHCKMVIRNKYYAMQDSCSCIPCCRWSVERRHRKEELKKREAEFSYFGLPVEAAGAQPTYDF